MLIHRITLVGSLPRAAEVRRTTSDVPFVACQLGGDDDGWAPRVTYWGRDAASLAGRLTAGTLVYVEGRLVRRTWQRRSGETERTWEVRAWRLVPLDRAAPAQDPGPPADEDDEAVPF